MKWTVIALVGLAAGTAVTVTRIMRQGNRKLILPEQLQRAISVGESILLVDVRTAKEFNSGHLPGAILLPHDRLLSSPSQIPRHGQTMIVVYCERGPRAKMAQRALITSGFSNVLHLRGDMSGWRASGLPVDLTPAVGQE